MYKEKCENDLHQHALAPVAIELAIEKICSYGPKSRRPLVPAHHHLTFQVRGDVVLTQDVVTILADRFIASF